VIGLPDGQTRAQIKIPGIPRLVSDDTVKYNNDDATLIGAGDMTSGELLWTKTAEWFEAGYLASADMLVQPRGLSERDVRSYEIVLIDLKTGAEETIYSRPVDDESLVLWPELSSETVAVMGFGYFVTDAGQSASVPLTTLDLSTGDLSANAYELTIGSR
jgi:hypothetical protein